LLGEKRKKRGKGGANERAVTESSVKEPTGMFNTDPELSLGQISRKNPTRFKPRIFERRGARVSRPTTGNGSAKS